MADIRLGDRPLLRVTITEDGAAVDLTGVTTKEIKAKPRRGATKTFTASFATDGTDGVLEYQTVENDIDAAGLWEYAGRVVDSANRPFESETATFYVERAL